MGTAGRERSSDTAAATFVGRRHERAWLERALERAAAGDPRVLVVAGNAGIGKSRLIQEVVDHRCAEWVVGVGHCVESGEAGLPYAALTGILGAIGTTEAGASLLAGVEQRSPGLLPLVPSGPADHAVDTTSGMSQLRLLDALVRLLGDLSEQQPVALVIEDLHWADRSTRAFVSFLCRNVVTQPLAVILTVRTDELHRSHPLRPMLGELARLPTVERIDLEPLDTDGVGKLLADVYGAPLARQIVERIAERSGGNPFFAEQLLALGAHREITHLPAELTDLLLHRVDRLTSEARHLLEVASLAGQRIDHDLLIAVSDRKEGEVTAALHEAADTRLFEPEPGSNSYRFRHALLAEVIAADMLPAERARVHARYATALASRASAATVAGHLLGAHDHRGAFAASIDAALEATSVAAPDDALGHWERVLELWSYGSDEERQRAGGESVVARRAAEAAVAAGAVNRAAELAVRARDLATDDIDRAKARLVLVPLLSPLVTGTAAEYAAEATSAITEADQDLAVVARAQCALARAHLSAGRFADAIDPAEAATVAAERLGLADVALGARATAFLARCEAGLDQPAQEVEDDLMQAALASDDVETGLWVLTKLADWWWPTHLDKGEQLAATACDYAAGQGVRTSVRGVWARETLALCRLLNGNWDAADELALEDPLPVNDLTSGTIALEAQIDTARGRLDVARRKLDFAHQVAPDALSRGFIAISKLSLHLAEGDPAAAVAVCVESLERLPPSTGYADLDASLVARGVGALADARERGIEPAHTHGLLAAADRVQERARTAPNPRLTDSPMSLLLAHRSRLDRSDPELWRDAVEHRAERPYDGAICRFHLAQALLEHGDVAAATAELHTAAEACSKLGAGVMLERIRSLADQRRIRMQPIDAAGPADEWQLTQREQEVLRLIAEGRTNRQIGEALFISSRTAGVHVSNILTKLQAANRQEAAAVARRAGLLG